MRMMSSPAMICWCCILTFTSSKELQGQSFYTRLHIGSLHYQGDLSPRPIDLSFGPANLAYGISTGYDITDWFSAGGRFLTGKISGDDRNAVDPTRKARNLSFRSPIYEYGVYADLKINKIFRFLDRYKVRWYITAGINLIHFNPQAYYQGKWVDLQPLGTEGQTLPMSDKQKYSLYNFSRPVGIIAEFDIMDGWSLGLEVAPRKTFTDNLDDVSGTYPDHDAMLANGNYLGAQLSNRMGDVAGTDIVKAGAGEARGNPAFNDWYTYFGLHLKYRYGKIREEKVGAEIQIMELTEKLDN